MPKRNSPDAVLWAGIMDVAREASPELDLACPDRPDLSALEEVANGLCDKASGQDDILEPRTAAADQANERLAGDTA